VTVKVLPSAAETANAVHQLTAAMEKDRSNAWDVGELGPRFDRLLAGIVAFRAEVTSTTAKFKLGQNERLDVLDDALVGLEKESSFLLIDAMRAANRHRLADPRNVGS
jgi:transcriptional regulator